VGSFRADLRHCMLSTFFVENLVANLLHQSRHVEIDAAGSQQVRWFLRLLDKRNVEKNLFRASQQTYKLDFRYVFYYSCLS